MRGNIFSRQKYFVCGGRLVHDERRGGCFCEDHPQVAATGGFVLKFGKEIRQESVSYDKLARKLTALRYHVDEDDFDPRDYQADKPLALNKLIFEYQKEKEGQKLKTIGNIRNYIKVATAFFNDANVKTIRKPALKKFLKSLNVSDKTKSNYLTTIRDFYTWLVDEEIISHHQVPDFPKTDFELGWRTLTNWETQNAILDKIYEMTWGINPKIWIGIDLLRTHANIRPGDLLKLVESDFDMNTGFVSIWMPTKRRNEKKSIKLLEDQVEMVREMKRRFPAVGMVKFFRHHGGVQSVKHGQPFGEKYFYKWWIRACDELGIKGLDLYGGTRHTTTTELGKRYGREAAREANENRTNKAFERYCQVRGERAQEMTLLVERGQRRAVGGEGAF